MRRTTSAWIAGILGAGLTATMVVAQQLPPSGGASRAGSAAPAAAPVPGSGSVSESSSLFGMAAARGSRYLLRNGLDYLNYQQYERALKFLREAEARDKELSAAEKLVLKQGIERAQSGLRAASDAEAPYALSERSRPRKGFTAARPEPAIAATSNPGPEPFRSPARTRNRSARPELPGDDSEGPGEPIRLASVDPPAQTSRPTPANNAPTARDSQGTAPETPVLTAPEIPVLTAPEIPRLTAPEIPALTAVPSSPGAADASPPSSRSTSATASGPALAGRDSLDTMPPMEPPAEPRDHPSDSTVRGDGANALMTRQAVLEDPAVAGAAVAPAQVKPERAQAPEPNPATVPPARPADEPSALPAMKPEPQPAADVMPSAGATNPSPVPAQAAPSPVPVEGAPSSSPAPVPIPIRLETPAPESSGPVPPSEASPAPTAARSSGVVDLDSIPLPPLDGQATRADDPGGPAHREAEPAAPSSSTPANPPSTSGVEPPVALTPEPVAPQGLNDLPPLPSDLSRNAATDPSDRAASALIAAEATAMPKESGRAHSEDEPIPALPSGPGSPPIPTATEVVDRDAVADTAARLPAHSQSGSSESQPADPRLTVVPDANSTPTGVQPALLPVAVPVSDGPAAPASNDNHVARPGPDGLPGRATDAGFAPQDRLLPPSAGTRMSSSTVPGTDPFLPERPNPVSRLNPDLQRRVDEVARNQERDDELRIHAQNRPQPETVPLDTNASNLQTQTQLDISRAPSPAEARPIKAIPVPDDWVPLAERNWAPQRKFWAAAATCHLPLYFQDPALERYGHNVEQFVGPFGRYFSYPVDDPRQSTQRNQIIQPAFSVGLMGLQIIAWPYNLVMDPPWEAQYDLGYWRPGDLVPTDVYWLPLHGYGPPLRGNRY